MSRRNLSLSSPCAFLHAGSRRGRGVTGADDVDGQRDPADMMSGSRDPTATTAGRKAAKGTRADGKSADGTPAEMMSKFRGDPDAELQDGVCACEWSSASLSGTCVPL